MADVVIAYGNEGAGVDRFVVDNIAADVVPVTKVMLGADGVDGGFVSDANPLPISGPVSINDPSTTVAFGPISTPSTALFTAVDTAGEISIQLQLTGRFDKGGV